jgi:hypothetical protein
MTAGGATRAGTMVVATTAGVIDAAAAGFNRAAIRTNVET